MVVPVIRIEEAGLGADAPVRLVLSGVDDPAALRAAWAPSGAVIETLGDRLRAVTTVEALVRAAGRTLGATGAEAIERAVRDAVRSWVAPVRDLALGDRTIDARGRTLVMGVVNVTPDSFFDGGALYPDEHPDRAVGHGRGLLAEGADVLDIGGESTRPGSRAVGLDEELRRVVPVVEALASEALVSVDTVKPQVARAALRAGARIVNDVSGGADRALLETAAEHGALYVLMHSRGTPENMQSLATYDDVVAEVYEFLAHGIARCVAAGIPEEHVLVDPGIGFAKTADHNLALLGALRQFAGLGRPLLLGASRKSFLGALLDGAPPEDRLEGSLACAALAAAAGAAVVRVHDVRPTVRVVRTVAALQRGSA